MEPELTSLNVQLSELNNRTRTYSARLWQLPLAYFGAAGVVLVQVSTAALPWMLLATAIVGAVLSLHLWGIEDGRNRATKALIDLERQLNLPAASRNRRYYTVPMVALTIGTAVVALGAAIVLWRAPPAAPAASPAPAHAISLGPLQVNPTIGLDGIVNMLVTLVLVIVTAYYARRANTIATKAETAREKEVKRVEREQRELAEARIGVVAYALRRQLNSWVREVTSGLTQLDKVYEYLLGSGGAVKPAMGQGDGKMVGTSTAGDGAMEWAVSRSGGEYLDPAEQRVHQLAVDAPYASEAIRTAIYDVTVLFYEGTRRITEQAAAGPGRDVIEIVRAYRQIRQCAAQLPAAISNDLRAAGDRLLRSRG